MSDERPFGELQATHPAGLSLELAAAPLTPAELRVLPYLMTHFTLAEIAGRLLVTRNTVNSQVAAIYRKLGATSRSTAVDRAIAAGLLERP